MEKVHLAMGTPNAYIQQPGLLAQAGQWIRKYGHNVFIVTGEKSWEAAGKPLTSSLDSEGVRYEIHRYRGECSYEEAARLNAMVAADIDLIVGVGGGKVLDTAKALSAKAVKPFVAVPTLAATCAAVTPLSVMYTEDGIYVDFPVFSCNSILTLVDTNVLAAAPVRFLVAGIGDTLAKWYEALASSQGKPHNLPTVAGLQMAKLCYDTLIEYSSEAIADAKNGRTTDALQKVIDAVILVSGMVGGLGESNCRSAAAHAIHNGLTVIPEIHHAYHGEKVAYGIIVQLVLESRPIAEIKPLLDFYKQVGLPSLLRELGIEQPLAEEQLREVARVSLLPESTMAMMPFSVTEHMVIDAIRTVEALPSKI